MNLRECIRPPLRQGYVDNLNKLIAETEFADMTLEEIITGTTGTADKVPIFNNAAQA